MKTAVHFGAGNIGRGFIGLLLRLSGYDVIFVDVSQDLVRMLNEHGQYLVRAVGPDKITEETVTGFTAINIRDFEAVANALARADIITTAVGKSALEHIAPLIAEGLRRRAHGTIPVLIVACENILGNSAYLENLIRTESSTDETILQGALFRNCVVDRIVPNITPEARAKNPLAVTVEEYYQWAIDASGLETLPTLEGIEFSSNLEMVLAQKLLTFNMAHAMAAYHGFRHGTMHIHEAIAIPSVRALVEGALRESGAVVTAMYGVATGDQDTYAQKVLRRLENNVLADDVTRVGREPRRKLGSNDRLVKPALAALDLGTTPVHLSTGIAAAFDFNAANDPDAQTLRQTVKNVGVKEALRQTSGVEHDHALAELVHANWHHGNLQRT